MPQAMINCRQLEPPRTAAKMLTFILNNKIYRIHTGHSISALTHQTNAFRRILGTGQCSYASPSIWVAVLDPILWSIAAKYSCFEVDSPNGKTISRIGDAYVDDTPTIHKRPNPSPLTYSRHGRNITEFREKLFSTGGRLNLKKYCWYLIAWCWEPDDRATMVTKALSPGKIKMTQGYNLQEKVEIHREKCDIAKRKLGTRINPAG